MKSNESTTLVASNIMINVNQTQLGFIFHVQVCFEMSNVYLDGNSFHNFFLLIILHRIEIRTLNTILEEKKIEA